MLVFPYLFLKIFLPTPIPAAAKPNAAINEIITLAPAKAASPFPLDTL